MWMFTLRFFDVPYSIASNRIVNSHRSQYIELDIRIQYYHINDQISTTKTAFSCGQIENGETCALTERF